MKEKRDIQYYKSIIQRFLLEKRHFLFGVGVFIFVLFIIFFLRTSYAALQPLASLPEKLTSKVDGVIGLERSTFIAGVPPNGLPRRFYAVDDNQVEYDIYCLDRWKSQLGDIHYTKDSAPIEDKGMAHLLSLIYPNDDNFLSGKSEDVKRYISQLTIWYYQDKKAGYSDTEDVCSKPEYANQDCKKGGEDAEADTEYWGNSLKSEEKEAIKKSIYWQEMDRVITAALAYREDNNYNMSVNQDEIVFTVTEDGSYMESNYVTVNTTGTGFLGYALTTTSKDVSFYNESGSKIDVGSTVSPDTRFKIKVPIATVKEQGALSANVNVSGFFNSKEAYLYNPEDSEFQRALLGVMKQTPFKKSFDLKIEYPMGSVKISKKDATTGNLLKGATLVVTDEEGNEVDRWVSEEAVHVIDPIKAGNYTLKEEAPPDGYVLNMVPVPFTVTERNTVQVDIKNTPTAGALVSKVDETTGKELPGATLTIKDAAGNVAKDLSGQPATWVSTNQPHLVSLAAGNYTLTEVIAPEGYVLSTQTVSFKVEDGKTTTVKMSNVLKGKAKIKKTDLVTGEEVEGATLVVTDQQGHQIDQWVSTKEPHYIESLADGVYILYETIAPEGYIKSEQSVEFRITAGKTTEVEMQNEAYGRAEINKIDSVTKKPIEGATLVVTDKQGTEIDRWVSTQKPHPIEKLPKGTYVLTEVDAPAGYVQKKQSVEFTIGPKKTTEVEMENEPYGIVEIEKIDAETGERLEGATLVIMDTDKTEYLTFESSKELYITKLPKGEYILKEIKSPDGYVVSDTELKFVVTPGESVQVSMQNVHQIDVPNTTTHIPIYFYIIAIVLFISGITFVGFSLKKVHLKE